MGRLRIVAFLEGLSFLIILGVAMPVKYLLEIESATTIIGMIHGVLFIAYILLIFPVKIDKDWTNKTTFLVLLASLLPFGTFVADYKIFRINA